MKINYDGVYFNVEAKGRGIPLVFLHGFSENISSFQSLNLGGFKCIFIDLIGHGKSESPKDIKYYNFNYLLRAINFIIKTITEERYALYGYSMGGRIALAYSFIYEDEIKALILESASYGEVGKLNRKNRRMSDYKIAKNISIKGIEWFEGYWSNLPIFKSQNLLSDDIKMKIKNVKLKNNINGLSKSLIGFSQGRVPCLKEKISRLKLKIIYISGELDKKYNLIGNEFEALNGNVNHVTIEASGHNIHMENPRNIEMIINNFIRMC